MNMEQVTVNRECLENILHIFDFTIDELIDNVLYDSETDPHYSAVTARNCIIWYIQVMKDMGVPLPYSDCEGYFKHAWYSKKQYRLFEKKRIKESAYYQGKQY